MSLKQRLDERPAYAGVADVSVDHTYPYYPNPTVFLRASSMLGKLPNRVHAAIMISPDDEPLHLGDVNVVSFSAAAISPSTTCRMQTASRVIALCFEPTNEHFTAFCALPGSGVLPLDRALFVEMDTELRAALCGELPLDVAIKLIERILAIVVPMLPPREPQDERVLKVCELVRCKTSISLSEIASVMGLSYGRASHLFVQAVGLSFRDYRLWYKLRHFAWLLWSGETHTSAAHGAGFSDSAHVCRTFQKLYGRPPSYFFDGRSTNIHVRSAPAAATRSAWRTASK